MPRGGPTKALVSADREEQKKARLLEELTEIAFAPASDSKEDGGVSYTSKIRAIELLGREYGLFNANRQSAQSVKEAPKNLEEAKADIVKRLIALQSRGVLVLPPDKGEKQPIVIKREE